MPILDVGEWREGRESDHPAILLVFARMLFPNNQERYEEFVSSEMARTSLKHQNVAPALRRVLDSASRNLYDGIPRKWGQAAGKILITIRTIEEKYPNHKASLNKVYWVLSEIYPTNKRDLQKAWKTSQSVSHLWSALHLIQDYIPHVSNSGDESPLANPVIFKLFLAIAEDMRKFGESYQTYRSTTYLLNAKEMWRLKQDIPLPLFSASMPLPINIEMPALSPDERRTLERYQAPQ